MTYFGVGFALAAGIVYVALVVRGMRLLRFCSGLQRSLNAKALELDQRECELSRREVQLRRWEYDLGQRQAAASIRECHEEQTQQQRLEVLRREQEMIGQGIGELAGQKHQHENALRELRRQMQRVLIEVALSDVPERARALWESGPDDNELFLAQAVEEVCATLPEHDRQALYLRFGLGGENPPRTYAEVGKFLGVSTERARQRVEKALRLLRHPSRSRPLRDFYRG